MHAVQGFCTAVPIGPMLFCNIPVYCCTTDTFADHRLHRFHLWQDWDLSIKYHPFLKVIWPWIRPSCMFKSFRIRNSLSKYHVNTCVKSSVTNMRFNFRIYGWKIKSLNCDLDMSFNLKLGLQVYRNTVQIWKTS